MNERIRMELRRRGKPLRVQRQTADASCSRASMPIVLRQAVTQSPYTSGKYNGPQIPPSTDQLVSRRS